jgi:hypothetical protein
VVIIDKQEFLRYSGVLASPENFPDNVPIRINGRKVIRMINMNESFQPGRPFPNDENLADIREVLENRPERKPDLIIGPTGTGTQDIDNIDWFHGCFLMP